MANNVQAMRGIFISFEGLEGAGKTTQVVQLRAKLEQLGREVVAIREPGGTVISEQIRTVLFDKESAGMDPTAEVFLFQSARAQVYHELIIPGLARGAWVLADRASDSSLVYQGIVGGFGVETITGLNDLSTGATYPNVTFLLDLPVELGLSRRAQVGDMNRIDLAGQEFHTKVRAAYLELAAREPARIVIIDATATIETIARQVWSEVQRRFDLS